MENLKHIIESLLFVAEEPLTVDKIKRITALAETNDVKDALAALSAEYDARPGGFYLDEVAGGFQIRTRPEYNEWIRKLIQPRPVRLSKAALETLVIIAYKQPIIRSDIEHLRGVDCGGVLRVLLERKLVRVLGRREIAGRPLIYATTKHFLEVFDLKNLNDLPTPKEIEELGASLNDNEQAAFVESTSETGGEFDARHESDTEEESSKDHETQVDRSGSSEVAEDNSGNSPVTEDTPHMYIATVKEEPAFQVSPGPPDEAATAGGSALPTDGDSLSDDSNKK